MVVVLVALLLVALMASLAFGSRAIPFGDVMAAILTDVDSDDATVVTSQRVPRTLVAVLAGVALGVAGALMQGHTRNPLADPGLFGVNAGAAFAVALLAFVAGSSSPAAQAVAALTGAAVVSVLVFVTGLGSMRGGALVMVAILGTTLSSLFASLATALQLLNRESLDASRYWEVGSVAGRDTSLLWLIVPLVALGLVLAAANGFALDALALGDDVARSPELNTAASTTRTSRSRHTGNSSSRAGCSSSVYRPAIITRSRSPSRTARAATAASFTPTPISRTTPSARSSASAGSPSPKPRSRS